MTMAAPSVDGSEGGNFIPPSQRPDGTWRKPRRVKEGYVPQDEVPLYESRGKQWAKSRSAYPVGLDPELIKASEEKSAAKNNAAPGKKKKKGASFPPVPNPGAFDDYDVPQQQQEKSSLNDSTKTSNNGWKKQESSTKKDSSSFNSSNTKKTAPVTEQATSVEPTKRLRNLRKKLRDIENLEQKIKSKELKNPDKDQLEKVSRKSGVQAEILALELELSMNVKNPSS